MIFIDTLLSSNYCTLLCKPTEETAVGKVTDKALIFVFTHCLFV